VCYSDDGGKTWSKRVVIEPPGPSPWASHDPAYRHERAHRSPVPLLLRDGRVIPGCNVENASYGLSVCAERNAVWKAVSEGELEFAAIAVTAREGHGAPPCGSCRQVLHEFAPRILVYWRNARGHDRRTANRRDFSLPPPAPTLLEGTGP